MYTASTAGAGSTLGVAEQASPVQLCHLLGLLNQHGIRSIVVGDLAVGVSKALRSAFLSQ